MIPPAKDGLTLIDPTTYVPHDLQDASKEARGLGHDALADTVHRGAQFGFNRDVRMWRYARLISKAAGVIETVPAEARSAELSAILDELKATWAEVLERGHTYYA